MITHPIKTVAIAVECEREYGDKLSFQIFMFAHSSIWDTWLSQILGRRDYLQWANKAWQKKFQL